MIIKLKKNEMNAFFDFSVKLKTKLSALKGILVEPQENGDICLVSTNTVIFYMKRIKADDIIYEQDEETLKEKYIIKRDAFKTRWNKSGELNLNAIREEEKIDEQYPKWKGIIPDNACVPMFNINADCSITVFTPIGFDLKSIMTIAKYFKCAKFKTTDQMNGIASYVEDNDTVLFVPRMFYELQNKNRPEITFKINENEKSSVKQEIQNNGWTFNV